jgi:8-oxo-dGTP pyrophosphatase MutT (NUDIX family)
MITKYTVGFLFRNQDTEVALIRKRKPIWQRGLLNGIGGHVEDGETPLECQKREFSEEADAIVDDWREFCVLNVKDAVVHFFVSRQPALIRSKTSETVGWYPVTDLVRARTLENLRWLIPMALDKDRIHAVVEEGNSPAEQAA